MSFSLLFCISEYLNELNLDHYNVFCNYNFLKLMNVLMINVSLAPSHAMRISILII